VPAKGTLVSFMQPSIHGPMKVGGTVVGPSKKGGIEVKLQQGGYVSVRPDEILPAPVDAPITPSVPPPVTDLVARKEAEVRSGTLAKPKPAAKAKPVKPETAAAKVVAEVKKVVNTEGAKSAADVHRRVIASLEEELEAASALAGFKEAAFSAGKAYGGLEGRITIDGEPVASMDRYGHLKWFYPEEDALSQLELPSSAKGTRSEMQGDAVTSVAKALSNYRNAGTVTVDIPGDGSFTVERNPYAIQRVIDRIKSGGAKPWQGLDAASLSKRAAGEAAFNARRDARLAADAAKTPKKRSRK